MQPRPAPSNFRRGFCELPIQLTCKSGLPSGTKGPCGLGGFGEGTLRLAAQDFPASMAGLWTK